MLLFSKSVKEERDECSAHGFSRDDFLWFPINLSEWRVVASARVTLRSPRVVWFGHIFISLFLSVFFSRFFYMPIHRTSPRLSESAPLNISLSFYYIFYGIKVNIYWYRVSHIRQNRFSYTKKWFKKFYVINFCYQNMLQIKMKIELKTKILTYFSSNIHYEHNISHW